MIEPDLAGPVLVAAIRHARPVPGMAVVWRLGQSGLLVQFAGATVLFDPYLSNHCEAVLGAPFDHRRLTRAPLDPMDLDGVDLILCSHDHLDHLDPPTIRTLARQNPNAVIAAPASAARLLEELGWPAEHILRCDDNTSAEVAGLRLDAFAVPHDGFDVGPLGHPYLGFTVGNGEIVVAHLGDARAHPRVVAALAPHSVDLLAVPINGRTAARAAMGFAGNMNAAEAVELAAETGAALTVPMHYDMFAQNVDVEAVDAFIARAEERQLPIMVLPVGRPLTLVSGRR